MKLRTLRNEDLAPIIEQKAPYCDERFHDFLQDLYGHSSKPFRVNTDWLDTRRNNLLTDLNSYFVYTGESFARETTEEIAEMLVTHCGQIAGETLAAYTIAHVQEASFLNEWARELKKGV